LTHPAPSMLASRRDDALSDIEDALDAIGVPKNHWRPRFRIDGEYLVIFTEGSAKISLRLEDPRSADEIEEDLKDEAVIEEGVAGDAMYERYEATSSQTQ
jgi:hypothetical protein